MPKNRPWVVLAPMAGLSDAPMRKCVANFGVDAVVSEMIASHELWCNKHGVAARATRCDADNTHHIAQIAGRDPELMAKTARFAVDQGADQVDINMGCPAKKVTNGATGGAALLRDEGLALDIVKAVAEAVDVPVSVKTRLGWDAHTTVKLAPKLVDAGAQMLTIHGRTRAQKYTGRANWLAVRAIKGAVDVPVLVNGDITQTYGAQCALDQSRADGVMVGRGAVGRPDLLAAIQSIFKGERPAYTLNINNILQHYTDIINFYGETAGVRNARKHLNAYFCNWPKDALQTLLRAQNYDDTVAIIDEHQARYGDARGILAHA